MRVSIKRQLKNRYVTSFTWQEEWLTQTLVKELPLFSSRYIVIGYKLTPITKTAHNRCCALKACLRAFYIATHPDHVDKAFSAAGIVISRINNEVVIDPSRLASHLPNPEGAFSLPLCPPSRSALYSCVINTPAIIHHLKVCKSQDPSVSRQGWEAIALVRDQLTEAEVALYDSQPDTLPWANRKNVKQTVTVAYEAETIREK